MGSVEALLFYILYWHGYGNSEFVTFLALASILLWYSFSFFLFYSYTFHILSRHFNFYIPIISARRNFSGVEARSTKRGLVRGKRRVGCSGGEEPSDASEYMEI